MAFLGSFPRAERTRLPLLLLAISLVLLGSKPARAQSDASKEYQIKAAFLFNFAKFVEWPSGSFAKSDAPFSIGILGTDPFGPALEETIRGETIGNRQLIIHRAQRIEDLQDCQMIFISKSEEGHVTEILSELDSKPILAVSEIDSFAQDGGDIDFYLQGGRVHFEINPGSARRVGLRISSQLLSLGKIVQP